MYEELRDFIRIFLYIFSGISIVVGIIAAMFFILIHFFGDTGLTISLVILGIALISATIASAIVSASLEGQK